MFFKKVLVPYDESEHAKSALHMRSAWWETIRRQA